METASLETKATECPVCEEYYREPKLLPCAHLLCRSCLVSWLKTNKNAQCPLCCCSIVDPPNRAVKTCDDVADELPTDDVMSEMVDNIKIFHQKHACYVHKDDKAKSFCLQCGFMLCVTCAEVHTTIPATSFHKLEELEKLTLESLTSCRQSPCSAHPDKTSKLYCVSHNVIICNVCALSKHRACPEVSGIHEILEKNKRSLFEMENRLSALESALSQVLAEIEERLVTLEQNTKDSFTLIDTALDRLASSIENCRQLFKKLVQDENNNVMAEINKQKDALSRKRGLITSHKSLINRVQLSASCTSLVSMVPQLNKRVSDLDLEAPLLSDWKSLTTVNLTIDEEVFSNIEMELSRLGQLSVGSSKAKKRVFWRFHANHGENTYLTTNGMAAELRGNFYGMVFSSEPMKVDMLYEVRVDETFPGFEGSFVGYGLVTEDPAAIKNMPAYSTGIQSAIVVFGDSIFVKTQHTTHDVDVAYKTFKVGSRIGVVVDAARRLRIYVDGKDQGVVYRGVKQPCYAVFDLCAFLKKVTVLPLTNVK